MFRNSTLNASVAYPQLHGLFCEQEAKAFVGFRHWLIHLLVPSRSTTHPTAYDGEYVARYSF